MMTPEDMAEIRRTLDMLARDMEALERHAWLIKTQLQDLEYKMGAGRENE